MPDQIIGVNQNVWQIDSNNAGLVTGSLHLTNATFVLQSGDINLGAVEIKDAESAERALVQGSRLQTQPLGSSYLLGIGSIQITNVPSFSGAGIFSTLGSQAITNTPSFSGVGTFNTLTSDVHPVQTQDLNSSFSFYYDSLGLSGMQMYTREGSNYQQDFLRSGNGDLIFLSSWY